MPSIGKACRELRVQDATRACRIVYFLGAVVILDVFGETNKRLRRYVAAVAGKETGP